MRDALNQRAHFLALIRQFFLEQDVVEVQTPKLLKHPTTDVYIDSISCQVNEAIGLSQNCYLHTSPELEMKKLLAHGSGDIYQICSVFRDNEQGKQNTNEFTLLEYYRLGFDSHQLMDDVAQLIHKLGIRAPVKKISYAQAFLKFADIDILNTDFSNLKKIAKSRGITSDFEWLEDLQIFLFTDLVEPALKEIPVCFIYDYPACQSALARVEGDVAYRFELYINGVEIANGYDELQNAQDYHTCFTREADKRRVLGKFAMDIDQDFLSELCRPIPQCSGVAIGIERLLSQI